MPADITSEEVVAGKPLKDRVKGANFEPGGIQEHHGFYHPGYMGWPLAYQAYAMLLDEHLPESQRNPDVFLRNWRLAFDRLKQGSFANGRFIYCAGYDWNAYGYGNAHILPIGIFAAVRFRDPDASRLAHEWLALVERRAGSGRRQRAGRTLGTFEAQLQQRFCLVRSDQRRESGPRALGDGPHGHVGHAAARERGGVQRPQHGHLLRAQRPTRLASRRDALGLVLLAIGIRPMAGRRSARRIAELC